MVLNNNTSAVTLSKPGRITDEDLYLFNEGNHLRLYNRLGSHIEKIDDIEVTSFALWAPNAEYVSVIGDFNQWSRNANPLKPLGSSGIWQGFIEHTGKGSLYKYYIKSRYGNYETERADPFAFYAESPPKTASVVWDLEYNWEDNHWMNSRQKHNSLNTPISIYEVHAGSWRRVPEQENRPLSYRELAEQLADYIHNTGFTHVEFLPIMEHPFYGSWGYQTTGFFAPTSRYGTPQDFMYLIDYLHRQGIGVILDWVPSHFPSDEHGLGYFDGTHLYEHSDPRQGIHPDWNTFIFNFGRNEVRSYLYSNAFFWLDKYHVDGLRVDAVASMLYLDYGRKENEWVPNKYGGRENLEAIDFIRNLNKAVFQEFPGVQTIAEESTAWPMVSRPVYVGGLGFGLKWDMGWMHDTLKYISIDPIFRKYHHNELTFRSIYSTFENFILPLSHDEVVYGKGSLLNKMPGDDWQKFANLRLLLGYMFGQGGKKLLFMGGEFGQWREWNHDTSLDWHVLNYPQHRGVHQWIKDLNRLYKTEKSMHELDCENAGFEWIDANDYEHSVLSFMRKDSRGNKIIVVCNFTPVTHFSYMVGIPEAGRYIELLNGDAREYGGSGQGNLGKIETNPIPLHGRPYSVTLNLPPLAVLFLKRESSDIETK